MPARRSLAAVLEVLNQRLRLTAIEMLVPRCQSVIRTQQDGNSVSTVPPSAAWEGGALLQIESFVHDAPQALTQPFRSTPIV